MFADGDSKLIVVDPPNIGGDELALGLADWLALGLELGVGPAEFPPPDWFRLELALGDGDGFGTWLAVGLGIEVVEGLGVGVGDMSGNRATYLQVEVVFSKESFTQEFNPLPASITSMPAPPKIRSFPLPPKIRSFPEPPSIMSFPAFP